MPALDPDLEEIAARPTFSDALARQTEGMQIKLGKGFLTVGRGTYSMGLDVAEKLGVVPRGTADDFARMSQEERQLFDKHFKDEFGENFGFSMAELTGETLPFLAIPTGALPAGASKMVASVISGITRLPKFVAGPVASAVVGLSEGAATGAAQGYIQPVEGETIEDREAKREQNADIGGAIGGVVGTAARAVTDLKNWVPNTMLRVYKEKRELFETGIRVQERTGVQLRLAQLLQDPEIDFYQEMAASGFEGKRLMNAMADKQVEDVKGYFGRLAAKYGGDLDNGLKQAFDETMGDAELGTGLLGARKANAARNFAAAQADDAQVPLTNYVKELDAMISEGAAPAANDAQVAIAARCQVWKERLLSRAEGAQEVLTPKLNAGGVEVIEKSLVGGGVVRPLQMQNLLQETGAAAGGNGKIFDESVHSLAERRPAGRLFGALNRDLDEAIDSGAQGADALRAARDGYREDTAKILAVENSALSRLFGDKNKLPSIDDVETAMLNMGPSEIKQTLGILQTTRPGMADEMRRYFVKHAFDRANVPSEAGTLNYVPARIMDSLGPPPKGRTWGTRQQFDALFPEGDPLREQFLDGVEAVRYLMVNNTRTGGRTVARLRNLAYAITNNNPGAMASFAADFLTPKFMSRVIFDPASVRALEELTKPIEVSRQMAAMNVLMTRYVGAAGPEDEDEQE